MAKSIDKMIDKLNNIVTELDGQKITDKAGKILVDNIRKNTNKMFKKGNSKWQYDYHGSFQTEKVTHYLPSERVVEIDHPAAKRLEYGQLENPLIIRPKNGKALSYIGSDGNRWFSAYEKIPAKSWKPLGYAQKSINQTQTEIYKQIKKGL